MPCENNFGSYDIQSVPDRSHDLGRRISRYVPILRRVATPDVGGVDDCPRPLALKGLAVAADRGEELRLVRSQSEIHPSLDGFSRNSVSTRKRFIKYVYVVVVQYYVLCSNRRIRSLPCIRLFLPYRGAL